MRIARIMTRLNLGGPARQALASDPELSRRGHELRLFTGAPQEGEGDLFEEAQRSGIDVVRVPGLGRNPKPSADLSALRSLRAGQHRRCWVGGARGAAPAVRAPAAASQRR